MASKKVASKAILSLSVTIGRVLLIGLALFLHPGCFCLAYHYFLCKSLLCGSIYTDANLKLSFEKLKATTF